MDQCFAALHVRGTVFKNSQKMFQLSLSFLRAFKRKIGTVGIGRKDRRNAGRLMFHSSHPFTCRELNYHEQTIEAHFTWQTIFLRFGMLPIAPAAISVITLPNMKWMCSEMVVAPQWAKSIFSLCYWHNRCFHMALFQGLLPSIK